jgi:hypothetical protein
MAVALSNKARLRPNAEFPVLQKRRGLKGGRHGQNLRPDLLQIGRKGAERDGQLPQAAALIPSSRRHDS